MKRLTAGMVFFILAACGAPPATPPPQHANTTHVSVVGPDVSIAASQSEAEVASVETEKEIRARKIAQAKASSGPGRPALWRLSDHDSTVYLFGTVHVLRPSTSWFSPEIKAAFDASEKLLIETDIHTLGARKAQIRLVRHYGLFPKGRTLKDYFETVDEGILQTVSSVHKIPADKLLSMKPWLIEAMLTRELSSENDYQRSFGVEEVLLKRAAKAGKSLGYLESMDDQISVLASPSLTRQMNNLQNTFKTLEEQPDFLDVLVDEWAEGDVAGLGLLAASPDTYGDEDYYEAILVNRNEDWLPKIKLLLAYPGTSFVAVGAAHLAGEDSVIAMLREDGLKVEGP